MNYFDYFNLPLQFNIKKKKIKKKYYSLQKKYHPDFYINCSLKKKKKALKKSIYINNGYKILKNPIKRIKYILKLHGYTFKLNKEKNNLKTSFLKKQYKYYETLEKIKIQKNNYKKINKFYKKIKKKLIKYQKKIEIKLNKKSWNKSFLIFQKLLFLKKIQKNIKKIF
ncbi:Co-chaperone protein HscB [Buchnera aphidicola (Periphyllus testudinaceus)]|uniref:Fe-S protein assembly co-chaperone HscB n=1 Tax=Buchnera aphidicola TaxID=9 RepID=UPI003463DC42